ncbi:MAG: hypothetical protein GYB64_16090, partial [Chloroflexi bacterium]|nr:hypothetical protein [Chloroflexota bacterium]
VYITFLIGREVFPQRRWLAVAGAAAVGFTPMFAFISGAVNNDNLAVLLAALGLYLMIRIARAADTGEKTLPLAVTLGLVLGMSALTKASVLGQFGLAGLTMAYAAFRQKRWQTFFIEGPIIVGLAAAIGGWWYWRNFVLYGDPFGLNVFIEILGERAREASLRQLWTEREGFMKSYWGLFGGVNVPMALWIYPVLNALFVLGWAGVIPTLVQKARRDGFDLAKWMPALLSLLWIAAVIVPLASYWARVTWSSQGRLVFSAIMSINLWMIAGLSAWLPERIGRGVAFSLTGGLAVLSIIAPFLWIMPAYRLPPQLAADAYPGESVDFTPPGASEPTMRLLGYEIDRGAVQPGGSVGVTLYWETLAPMDRPWSTFVHLQDDAGFLAGQRDTYPGLGRLATQDLEPGRRWVDQYVVPVDPAAYAPEELTVLVGLYDFRTCPVPCERMTAEGPAVVGGNSAALATVTLRPAVAADTPNPVAFDFGERIALVGYELSERTLNPGEETTVTLYWQGLREIEQNYTVSVQVLAPDNSRVAQVDRWPQNGGAPTAGWEPGAVVIDPVPVRVDPEAVPGEYRVQVVLYTLNEDGSVQRLQRLTPDGRLIDDFLILTRLRVVP